MRLAATRSRGRRTIGRSGIRWRWYDVSLVAADGANGRRRLATADSCEHGTRSAYVHLKCRCEQCRLAEKAYQQAYRAANLERLREYDRQRDSRDRDDPLKRKARMKAYDQIVKRGGRKPCERCGAENGQMHHDDYDRPLAVRWLCAACHGVEHRQAS